MTVDSLYQIQDLHRVTGIPGDPVPYLVRNDDILSAILIATFCFLAVLYSMYRRFLWRQAKQFFSQNYAKRDISETSGEVRFMLWLSLINCLMLAFATYFRATQDNPNTLFTIQSHALVIALFTGCFVAYFLLKWGIYTVVNLTFFDAKKNLQWIKGLFFLTAIEGLLLFPVIILQVYFNFQTEKAVYYFYFVLILNKILTFYHCKRIFFYQKDGRLQIFLYFCALEIVTLLAFSGLLGMIVDDLKINF